MLASVYLAPDVARIYTEAIRCSRSWVVASRPIPACPPVTMATFPDRSGASERSKLLEFDNGGHIIGLQAGRAENGVKELDGLDELHQASYCNLQTE